MSFELKFNSPNEDLRDNLIKTEEELNNIDSEETNRIEIKTFDESIKELSQLIIELKNNIPSAESLTDIYNKSLSPDHYHAERGAEASILMMLRANIVMISDNLLKYKNYSDSDSSSSRSLSLPDIGSIENLKNILNMNTGTSRAKFMDADNFKLYDLIDKLEGTVTQARDLL